MSRSSPSFEDDMRRIREKRNVSRETIHEETKIALENLELFEEGKLDRHPHFNEVYLRAVVRAYAEVLDMSKERALQALERARSGAYRGELGVAYLDREAPSEEPPSEPVDEQADEGQEQLVEDAPRDTESGRETEESEDVRTEDVPDEEDSGPPVSPLDVSSSSASGGAGKTSTPAAGGERGVIAAIRGKGKIVLGTGILVLLALLVWALGGLLSGSAPPPTDSDSESAAADTVTTTAPKEVDRSPNIPAIGDSLEFTVIAAEGKLEPIRIRRDDGPWNPYWIEEGDSMSFQASEVFALRSYLPRTRLRVESFEWPIRATSRYDTHIVRREHVQQHIDSLSAARGN